MYPFERFTERAKKVLTLAQEEAERSHHSYIGTEHLLLGLLRERDGLAAIVLANLGVEIGDVRHTIESVLVRNERIIIQQIIPTSRVKKVIEISFEEAQRMGHNFVGTEHLLLGLLLEGEGIAAHVLGDLGATLDKVRAEIERLLRDSSVQTEGELSSLRYEPTRRRYEVGQRVLVHDPDPPHRLWEGHLVETDDERYVIEIAGHEGSKQVVTEGKFLHPIPMIGTRGCPFCLA